jgi:phosphoribosylformimino-5-aminoimidazole carboxamide ribotide isomerase
VIGVIDLLAGDAVHAVAGQRENYAPVRAVAGSPIEPGDALALARAYVERFGLTELYAADLDAILGRPPQNVLTSAIAALTRLWVDAGVRSVAQAEQLLVTGAARVVVGLETLPSYDTLEAVCAAVGSDRVAFSLDLRNGEPVTSSPGIRHEPVDVVARRAAEAGAGAVIVLDLARVGTGRGLDLALIERVRDVTAGLLLVAGGGVHNRDDIAQLARCGCDGVLVASALQNGQLEAGDIAFPPASP